MMRNKIKSLVSDSPLSGRKTDSMRYPHITILGGGPAGLAVGYYARKHHIPFTLYEATNHIGGNCITFRHGDFLFDSGAHRFHNRIPDVTNEIKTLLSVEFEKIEAPSSIYFNEKFIDFPLSPLNLLKNLGLSAFFQAVIELLAARLSPKDKNDSFEHFAIRTYGRSVAEWFLLSYSEKLWGLSSAELSPKIAGNRMKGLNLQTFIAEALLGRKAKTAHLDGSFYYPSGGIGTISDKLAEFCGEENIRKAYRVTRVIHDKKRICAVEVNGSEKIPTDFVASTLPINLFLGMMEPPPDTDTFDLVKDLQYRSMVLVAFFLNKNRVSENASIYFPDPDLEFTRIYEPKNRSCRMSPHGKTSLVVEIPCQQEDAVWKKSDEELIMRVRPKLVQAGLIKKDEIIDSVVKRIPYAYPILDAGFEEKLRHVVNVLARFSNLGLSGRNGMFVYGHIHDMMAMGKEIVERYRSENH